jgi:hypothetical protein
MLEKPLPDRLQIPRLRSSDRQRKVHSTSGSSGGDDRCMCPRTLPSVSTAITE